VEAANALSTHRWDEDFQKKPAYDAILNAYGGAPSDQASNSNNSSVTSSAPAISSAVTSASIRLSTGIPDRSTPAFAPSASAMAAVATGEAECEVEYVYA